MRYFTGRGDDGTTDLLGERVVKDDPRIEALGALDEASSAIGVSRSWATDSRMNDWVIEMQRDLYQIMAELAFTDETRPEQFHFPANRTEWLQKLTETLGAELNLPPRFVIPGDTREGAFFDVARTVVRRAERTCVALDREERLPNPEIIRYLNRLSSFLFLAARQEDVLALGESTEAKQ